MEFVELAYQVCVVNGIQPSEFWKMEVREFFWFAEGLRKQNDTENKPAADSVDWDELRRMHKEKQRGF
jgi:hypothetical protein